MTLVLSRVAMNPLSADALHLAGSPKRIHGLLAALFCSQEDAGRVLFRVDTTREGPDLLVQSASPPDWSRLLLPPRALREPPASKPLELAFDTNQRLAFRLLARTVRRAPADGKEGDGPRRDLRTDEERLGWLRRQGERAGFRVETCGRTLLDFASVHSDAPFRQAGGSFTGVRFDGTLIVTNADALRQAIAAGLGTQKAFGFGLLSVARER